MVTEPRALRPPVAGTLKAVYFRVGSYLDREDLLDGVKQQERRDWGYLPAELVWFEVIWCVGEKDTGSPIS